jgi:hypothetical protein
VCCRRIQWSWEAAITPDDTTTVRLPTTMTSVGFQGYNSSPGDQRDHEVSIDDLKNHGPYPDAFNIYKDKSSFAEKLPFVPHIYAQGKVATCVCNAFASAYVCDLQRQGHDPTFRPSRLFLYYLTRLAQTGENENRQGKSDWFANMATEPPTEIIPTDQGSRSRDVLKAISSLECCAEAESLLALGHESQGTWPYIDLVGEIPQWMVMLNSTAKGEPALFPEGAICRLAPSRSCFTNATRHRTLRYARPKPVDDVNCWKALIQAGYPIVFAIKLYSSFNDSACDAAGDYVAKIPDTDTERYDTGHMVMAVGWDDSKGNGGAFRIQNSWGDKWADGGFCWMEYGWLRSAGVQNDAWVLIDSEDQASSSSPWHTNKTWKFVPYSPDTRTSRSLGASILEKTTSNISTNTHCNSSTSTTSIGPLVWVTIDGHSVENETPALVRRPRTIVACTACRLSKAACDGKKPCERCHWKGAECQYRKISGNDPNTSRSESPESDRRPYNFQNLKRSGTAASRGRGSGYVTKHWKPPPICGSLEDHKLATIANNKRRFCKYCLLERREGRRSWAVYTRKECTACDTVALCPAHFNAWHQSPPTIASSS